MIKTKLFSGKTFLILGMGITGNSLAESLLSSGAKVFFWDDDINIRNLIKKNLHLLFNNKVNQWNQIDFVIPSPGIHINGISMNKLIKKAKKYRLKIISELDLFQLYINQQKKIKKNNIKIIAITGTNGKSTVVSLIHHMLVSNKQNSSLIGNIGNSIFKSKPISNGFYVIEVSSYQLEASKIFSPNIAVIVNFSQDHLDRHKTIKNYLNQKIKIFKSLDKNSLAIINNSHYLLKKFSKDIIKSKLFNVSIFNFRSGTIKLFNSQSKISNKILIQKINIDNLSLQGDHNQENAQIAIHTLQHFNFNRKNLIYSIKKFKGLPHRQELVYKNKNIEIINDSKATNFESMIPALKTYKNIFLICGGKLKGKNISILDPYKKRIKKVYVTGKSKDIFKKYFSKSHNLFYSSNMNQVIKNIHSDTKNSKNITILFSPGAASFDQYKNFEERGNNFKKIISKYYK